VFIYIAYIFLRIFLDIFVFDFLQSIIKLVIAKIYSQFLTFGEQRRGGHQKYDGENEHGWDYCCS